MPMIFADAKLYTTALLARHLRVKSSWVRDEADAGRLPYLHAGDTYLFDKDAVEAVLLKRARRTPAPTEVPP